jgi:hypothetical protein
VQINNGRGFTLVTGSGLYSELLGKKDILSSWPTLLSAVAEISGLKWKEDWKDMDPTLVWESMIISKQLVMYNTTNDLRQANVLEKVMKKDLAHLLKKEWSTKVKVDRAAKAHKMVDVLMRLGWNAVIDLNFISLFHDNKSAKPAGRVHLTESISKSQRNQLCKYYITSSGIPVFHPNGHVVNYSTIRLGYRDYGLQSTALAWAFSKYKSVQHFHRLQENYRYSHSTWINHFMNDNLVFLGTGLSPMEIGLRWALSQKRRNYIKDVSSSNKPINIYFQSSTDKRSQSSIRKLIASECQQLDLNEIKLKSWEDFWKEFG